MAKKLPRTMGYKQPGMTREPGPKVHGSITPKSSQGCS